MTDAHWGKIKLAVGLKMGQPEVFTVQAVFTVFRANWELFCDEDALDTFLDEQQLAVMQDTRDRHQEIVDELDVLIAEM